MTIERRGLAELGELDISLSRNLQAAQHPSQHKDQHYTKTQHRKTKELPNEIFKEMALLDAGIVPLRVLLCFMLGPVRRSADSTRFC